MLQLKCLHSSLDLFLLPDIFATYGPRIRHPLIAVSRSNLSSESS